MKVATATILRSPLCRSHHEAACLFASATGTIAAMRSPILSCAIILTLSLGALSTIHADSATWNLHPTSGNWDTAANWTPATVPNGPADIATFSTTSRSTVSLVNVQIEVASLIFDNAATNYTITVGGHNKAALSELTIGNAGIVNNSGKLQTFVADVARGTAGEIIFIGNAHAGTFTQFTMRGGRGSDADGGLTLFNDQSSADNAALIIDGAERNGAINGEVRFFDNSTAGSATFFVQAATGAFRNNASVNFFGTSSGGNSVITAEGAAVKDASGGAILFWDSPTAGNATCVANGGSADGALGGRIGFLSQHAGDAGQATLIANGGTNGGLGGFIYFVFSSHGGEAQVEVYDNGYLDLSDHDAPGVTIGSLSGSGFVYTGSRNLTIGSNNLSTTFSGIIQEDGGIVGGTNGSITKLGTGTLTLSGASIYTGGTTVTRGVLKVANTTGSATGTGPVNVDVGTLGGSGIIGGAVALGTGTGAGAVLAPSGQTNVQPGTLTINGNLTFNSDATYTCTFKAKPNRAKTDLVIANGVTINSGAMIELIGHVTGALSQGFVLTLISNTSANPISGTFSNLPDGGIVRINGNNFQASYSGGDGNDLTLTVVP
jgi:autotransporter-associated beta strand protein